MHRTPIPRKPTILIIMDGFGLNPNQEHNAIKLAKTPNLDELFNHRPMAQLEASGRAVGLPEKQMGNSEVGHLTIGSGAILRQDLVRIDDAIAEGSFQKNEILLNKLEKSRQSNRPLHLIGLCSDGGVHSHLNHLYAFLDMCQSNGVKPSVHMITDGRDTPPQSAQFFVNELQDKVTATNGVISSISGRFYSMDRDRRWERTRKTWQTMVYGENPFEGSAKQAIEHAYSSGQNDEFIEPMFLSGGETIQSNDCVIFFNFRNDRARQLSYVLAGQDFIPFDRGDFNHIDFTSLTEYDDKLGCSVVFEPEYPPSTLAEVVAECGLHQFHCAETEKYAHVTFFLNGGKEKPFPGEEREMIPSPKVDTYDLAPQMSAKQVADTLVEKISLHKFGFIVANFANGDMVGHTAKESAVISAVETLDVEVNRVINEALNHGYSIVLTADHGNCELMVDPETGEPHTQHTNFPVPCLVIDDDVKQISPSGGLSQIAATILELIGLPVPSSMQPSLLSGSSVEKNHAA